MRQTIRWSKEEAIILLNALLLVLDGKMPRKLAVALVSNELRKRAIDSGYKIDDVFRNTNGISLQMSTMEYLLTEGKHGLKKSSYPRLFEDTVNLYKTNPQEFYVQLSQLSDDTQLVGRRKREESVPPTEILYNKGPNNNVSNTHEEVIHKAKKISQVTAKPAKKKEPEKMPINKAQRSFMQWLKRSGYSSTMVLSVIATLEQCSNLTRTGNTQIDFFIISKQRQLVKSMADLKKKSSFIEADRKSGGKYSEALALLLQFKQGKPSAGKEIFNPLIHSSKQTAPESGASIIDRLGKILAKYYSVDGYELDNNQSSARFRQFYSQEYKESLNIEKDQLDRLIISAGVETGDRIFPSRDGLQNVLLEQIEDDINQTFSSGATLVYLSCLLEKYQSPLASNCHVFDEESLFDLLVKHSKGQLEKRGKPPYISLKGVMPSPERDVRSFIQKSYHPQLLETIQEQMWYIPKNKVAQFLNWDDKVQYAQNTYFYSDNLPIRENDILVIQELICKNLDNNGRFFFEDFERSIAESLPSFFSDFDGFSVEMIWKCLPSFLDNEFIFKGNYIVKNRKENATFQPNELNRSKVIVGEKTATWSQQYRTKLCQNLYSLSQVYDDPAGLDISKIISLLGKEADEQLVREILKDASWATQITNDTYSFSKKTNAMAKEPTDYDKDKFVQTLLHRYRSGMQFDSIDFENFREMYETLYDESLPFDDAELQERLLLCGVYYHDRLFPAEGIIDCATREKLFAFINNSFASGAKVLYYKAIFEGLADEFASCFTLSDENMLRAYLEFTADTGMYYFSSKYMSTEKNVSIDHTAEVEDFLLAAGKPMTVDDISNGLPHIPKEQIYSIIIADSRFLRNARGEYFAAGIFEVSDDELECIADIINEYIQKNDYAIWTDVWKTIQEKMPVFLETNLYLSRIGVRNVLAQQLSRRFNFESAVISMPKDRYTMREIFQLYAKHHDVFTADDIYNLSKELDTIINYDALAEVSVRVSHDLFVSKDMIHFDIAAVDKAIGNFVSKDFIPIREIDSYLIFPNVEYEWNEYLLESFVKSYSKKYDLLSNGFSLNNVAGAVSKKTGVIHEFVDACASVLADAPIDLNKQESLNYLAEINMITRRSYRDIDLAINKATRIRNRKG